MIDFPKVLNSKLRTLITRGSLLLAGLTLLLLSACSTFSTPTGIPSALDPRGEAAANIDNLWWFMFVIGALIFLLVSGLLLYTIFRRRRYQPDDSSVELNGGENHSWIWYGGIILPAVILTLVTFFTLRSISATAQPSSAESVEI